MPWTRFCRSTWIRWPAATTIRVNRAQLRLLDLWNGKQMVSRRLFAYDTTNFYTYIYRQQQTRAMNPRNAGITNRAVRIRARWATAMCWMEKTASAYAVTSIAAMWPTARNFLQIESRDGRWRLQFDFDTAAWPTAGGSSFGSHGAAH
jgi:hypothetical protein